MSGSQSIDDILGQYQTVYDVYFSQADSTGSGAIGAVSAFNFLKQSKLKESVLKEIWELADPTGKGYLDRNAFYITLKYIALAQANHEVKPENLSLPTPAPNLGELSSNIPTLIAPNDVWYIKASQRLSFDKLFESLSPINNKITGARVKPFLINSKLPVDVLGRIWELSDLDQDGQLDRDEFLIAMQLVTKAKEGQSVPDILPPSLLPFKVGPTTMPTVSAMLPGQMAHSLNVALMNETKPWVVSVEEKAKSDIVFNQLDTDADGYVNGAEVKDVFLKTGLSSLILANIWNLCDIGATGRLNCEQFALAMHFINKKLATGLDAPMELLPEMVPPTLRPKQVISENAHISKELEELQTQVTDLQREKLFYDQRASEHDMATRQKRTELSNLELEMDSLFKTQQEREMKKNEELKRLADFEDKQSKLNAQHAEFKEKYESEQRDIEKLKLQIQHMDAAMKNKDQDLTMIKTDLLSVTNEQAILESKIKERKANLADLTNSLQQVNFEVEKSKNKVELLKRVQGNLNKLIKEYDAMQQTGSNTITLTEQIKGLEEENIQLNKEMSILLAKIQQTPFVNGTSSSTITIENASFGTNDPFAHNSFNENTSSLAVDDPFQTFDPFKDTNGKSSMPTISESFDPFATTTNIGSNQFDPFNTAATLDQETKRSTAAAAPPRPAPPRPQTPSLKPTKQMDASQRPQSAMDFTRNNKLDLFNDFADPFLSMGKPTAPAAVTTANKNDPFGGGGADPFNWDAFSTQPSTISQTAKEKDPFDPFA